MTFADLHLTDIVAAGLEQLGWLPTASSLRDVAPTVARGHNLVAVTPPAPAYAVPALAGLLSRKDVDGILLVVAPAASIAEWTAPVNALAPAGTGSPLVVLGPGQATRRLRAGTHRGLLVGAPATLLDLRGRALLPADRISAVLVAWPETWESAELLTELLQDVSKDAQRVVLTSDPVAVASLLERHVWRALTVGAPRVVPVIPPLRVAEVAWSRRPAALAELAEVLDAESIAVWTLDRAHHAEIGRALAGLGVAAEITMADPAPAAEIIAFDLPTAEQLARLCQAGRVTLLVTPGTAAFVARLAPKRTPLLLPGVLDAATGAMARRRGLIERAMTAAPLDESLAVLSPLFERHEPAAVAAALYHLWNSEPRHAAPPPEPAAPSVAKVWISAGRKDLIGPDDLVGLLTNQIRVERSLIGRIELRDTFSLIELPAGDAARIAEALTGRTLKRKRLLARVDRQEEGPRRAPRPERKPRRPS